mmetsp:Transcript_33234/g.71667  ORF Transcript_33234/g.71667 Transcript_33234/m.71667 type:complete len:100 (-) Transcript_33234:1202-1501(-)
MAAPKKSAVDLAKFIDKGLHVKLGGGREVRGTLKGYDALLNIVLDEAEEYLRDPEDSTKMSDNTRKLGLVVLRGTTVMTISPTSGVEQIANPFTSQAQE